MCCGSALLATRTYERHLHSRISGVIADRSKPFGYQKLSLGVQDSVDSGAAARYLIFSLPLLLIFMAEGIDWLARHVRIPAGAAMAAWGLTALIVVCWTPYIRAQFLAKEWWPYRRMAEFLHGQMQKNDVIVAGWSIGFTLSQFFDESKDRIMPP